MFIAVFPQNNDRNIESLRTDLKREVSDTVKKPEDKAVYGNWMQNIATPAVRGTSQLLGHILGLFKDSAIKIVVQVISTALMGKSTQLVEAVIGHFLGSY